MSSELILHISKLNKRYINFALQDVSMELPKGSIMGFIGPNGAGKSTTIKSILNIIPFDSGEILIDGMNNVKNGIEVKKNIGYVSEQLNLYREVSAGQLYKFVSSFYDDWDDNLFQHLINVFGIDLTKKIDVLSKGTAVKFALSLALSHHPKLLIMDEPTSGLDPVVRSEVLELLQDIVANEQGSVFFSSHITEDIAKIADYVTYIDKGTVMLSDKKENILKEYKKVSFKEEVPEHLRHHIPLYRNKTAIVKAGDSIEFISILGLQEIFLECSPAALDEILLFLIKENE